MEKSRTDNSLKERYRAINKATEKAILDFENSREKTFRQGKQPKGILQLRIQEA